MSKTAVFILNHNLPDYTDMLYESLKPHERYDYDLFIIDNGSSEKGMSKYTSFRLDENVYMGGGFNAGMQYTLENKKYDSMLFMNNDLTVHPYNFVRSLREEMFNEIFIGKYGSQETKYDVVSPSFYNIEPNSQCHWKSMHSWNSKEVRDVSYIDFQSPLISRRLLEQVKEIDSDLMYGWGICFYFALVARNNGWKLGMVDRCCILHHNSLTVKRGVAGIDIPTYCRKAEEGQFKFFQKTGLYDGYMKLRKESESYEYKN